MADYNDSFKSFVYMYWDLCWMRKKPMWYWAGDTVPEDEITDVCAYNRANGIMWLCFSLPLWIGTIIGACHSIILGANIILVDGTVGLVLMMIAYTFIRKKYKKVIALNNNVN